jgi:hypothetical protein
MVLIAFEIPLPDTLHFLTGFKEFIQLAFRLDATILYHEDVIGALQDAAAV